MKKLKMPVRALCEGALLVALAMVLNEIKLFRLPNGGSITLEMLPIFVYALRWGVGPGALAGLVFGALQMALDGAIAWGWQSLLLDYLLAFPPLGLAGLFRGKEWGVFVGSAIGALGRFAVHFISGVTIYAITVPTEIFSVTCTSPALYSLLYNGSYMLINTVLCMVVLALMMVSPLKIYLLGTDLRRKA